MIEYKYSEDEILDELKSYVDKTYGEHYAQDRIQATEFIIDAGHGEGFCIGNIIKYAQRYGKKEGKNRKDLLKVVHYAIMALHIDNMNRNINYETQRTDNQPTEKLLNNQYGDSDQTGECDSNNLETTERSSQSKRPRII